MTENTHDPDKPADDDFGDEPSEGVLPQNDELEAALQAATDSMESRQGDASKAAAGSADKITIEALSTELRDLTEQHTASLQEVEALKDKQLRLQADFENVRRRALKEKQETLQYGAQNIVKDLLPVVDNLERALEVTEAGSSGGELQSVLQGVELVRRELLGVLSQYGVAVIEAHGQPFDPEIHEAMAQVPDDSVPPNTVVQVLQKGYQMRARMLRPARVVVSKASPDGVDGSS